MANSTYEPGFYVKEGQASLDVLVFLGLKTWANALGVMPSNNITLWTYLSSYTLKPYSGLNGNYDNDMDTNKSNL